MIRKLRTYAVFVLAVALAVTAGCKGGGSSGGGGGTTPTGGVVNGTFVKDAHKTSVGPWAGGHFDTGYGSWRTQHLYSGTSGTTQIYGSGYITAIGFKADGAVLSAFTCTGVTITMGHTSLGVLKTAFTDNIGQSRGAAVTVLNDRTVTIPAVAAGEYFRIDLDTPFHFNGVEKLVVDLSRAGTCTGSAALQYDSSVPGNQALYTDNLAATTGILTSPPNMRFHFSGGDSSVEFGGASAGPAPFTSASSRVLLLYMAGEINGSGPITGLGFQTD